MYVFMTVELIPTYEVGNLIAHYIPLLYVRHYFSNTFNCEIVYIFC